MPSMRLFNSGFGSLRCMRIRRIIRTVRNADDDPDGIFRSKDRRRDTLRRLTQRGMAIRSCLFSNEVKEMEDLIVELYFELLQAGPTYGDVEQWDPTLDALILDEFLRNYIQCGNGGDTNE